MSAERLNQLSNEMRGLCAELETSATMTEVQRERLSQRAECLCEELEGGYGVPAFRPEVPEAMVEMFFTLSKVIGLEV